MKRSKFNLSNTQLLTGSMGYLYPVGMSEVLAGDTIEHSISALVRCAPLVTPPMHPVRVKVHHWFVPFRIIWEDWEKFITGGPDGMDASVFPTINFGSAVASGTLADYLGVPQGFTGDVSALPFRAYAKIFNEWYRDQDLVTALTVDETSGADTTTNVALQLSAWEKDYFTTARPWEQKGAAVSLPLGTSAPVFGTGKALGLTDGTLTAGSSYNGGTGNLTAYTADYGDSVGGTTGSGLMSSKVVGLVSSAQAGATPSNSGLYADLSSATAVNVNDVREAFALQRYEEARARYGSRYTEYLAYLGVRSSDARLQRPEYLGGGKQTISFSEVLQTGSTTADANGVGQLYGHGIAAMRSNRYRKFFEEHGYVISLMSVIPDTMYPQGLRRTWNRRVKEDFWQKELQHIGQQPILMKELYALGAGPETVFGYQDRYDDYRYNESSVHAGFFNSNYYDWHFARLLAAEPTLNSSFIQASVSKRPFQDQSGDTLLISVRHRMAARRLIAARGSSFLL